eukprot:TRINITY_DN52838_c0_g1_i1.p2 TRINITY_DN52838_c0_g1~~TRINITY_DN52838_c0_g1_i1.p2  ORF type:complete len:129 (+),score=20.56 TRINITY_DN52838_c0_g1_i1:40-426(+)
MASNARGAFWWRTHGADCVPCKWQFAKRYGHCQHGSACAWCHHPSHKGAAEPLLERRMKRAIKEARASPSLETCPEDGAKISSILASLKAEMEIKNTFLSFREFEIMEETRNLRRVRSDSDMYVRSSE